MTAVRPATRQDLQRFFGDVPPMTMRAVVAEEDGEILGVAGVKRENGCLVAFSDAAADPAQHKRLAVRMAREVLAMMRGRTVYAVSRTESALLPHMGFEHVEGEVWRWHR